MIGRSGERESGISVLAARHDDDDDDDSDKSGLYISYNKLFFGYFGCVICQFEIDDVAHSYMWLSNFIRRKSNAL